MQRPQFWGIHAVPSKTTALLLSLLPFLLVLGLYFFASEARLAENPNDKLLPSFAQMGDATYRMAFTEDRRTGDYLLLKDTLSSLGRIFMGVGIAALVALLLGLNIGLYKGTHTLLNPIVTFISMIPPLAILPILFIVFGIGELGKVMLIFIGSVPILTRDISLYISNIPKEMLIKAQTLGASGPSLAYKIIMPQVIPRLIESLRLTLGGAWLYLIAAEAIASTDGLGYRIFLMRRYMNMDVIIPYVVWITILGVLIDFILRYILKKCYPWYLSK